MFHSDPWLLWPLSATPAHLSRVGERVWCQGRILLNAHHCSHGSHQRNVLQNPSHRLEGKPGSLSEFNLKVFLPFFFLLSFFSLFPSITPILSFFFFSLFSLSLQPPFPHLSLFLSVSPSLSPLFSLSSWPRLTSYYCVCVCA